MVNEKGLPSDWGRSLFINRGDTTPLELFVQAMRAGNPEHVLW